MRPKGKPNAEVYALRKEALSLLENQAEIGNIELFYADETRFSEQGYVPYGWQFKDEEVAIEVSKGKSINCFGLLSRTNRFLYKITEKNINSDFVIEFLDDLSLNISKFTFVVLDNARIHTARKVKQLFKIWQKRGLFIFYLPPYSPHLNIIERLWKEMKQGWIKPDDYKSADDLFFAVNRICSAIGNQLFIKFSMCAF
ncbi:MAG: IS630 family transposase [Flavobacteriales bacterium]|nr:IS630 family transposase [Flavobacteriales bacterium]